MIDQPRHVFGVSLVEAVLARWLVAASGREYVVDRLPLHPQRESPSAIAARSDAADEHETDGFEADDRFPGLNRFGRLLEVGAGHLEVARAAYREQGRQAAVQARALAAFAAARPRALLDRPDEEVGAAAGASRGARPPALTEVSEWAVDEVMVAFGLSSPAAGGLLVDSITLAERLPATLDALEDGRISWVHARMLAELVGPVKEEARAGVEARLLARAEGKTVSQLRVAARRAVMRADAAAHTKRLAAAIRERSVRTCPGRDGMGTLAATMPIPLLEACKGKLRAYAEECATSGHERTLDQRMLDCLADLILRPGETDLPPVQAQLTIVATVATLAGGDEPGEVNGQPLSALEIRELAYVLDLLPRPGDTEPPASGQAALGTSAVATEIAAAGMGQLLSLRWTSGTALAEPPHVAIVDEISGQLLALTNGTGIRHTATCGHPKCRTGKRPCTHPPAGPGLGPPPPTARYSPSDQLARFVRARDRRCRFPGCRAAAIRCDLDHNLPWPHGSTSADNLCCLCRHHHRLSHQAPGWTMTRLPDGALQWTTPGGHTVTTHPIGYGTDDDLPPELLVSSPEESGSAATSKPVGILEHLRHWPPPPPHPDEEPAPF
jgi:hypothetical protein